MTDPAPTAANDSFSVNEDGSVSLDLLGNDSAADGGLSLQSINGTALSGGVQAIAVSNGTVNVNTSGTLTVSDQLQIGTSTSVGVLNLDNGAITTGGWTAMNLGSIVETLNLGGTRTVMVQRYVPEIVDGDKRVLVIGGGVAGEHAATMALGMQADVTVIDISLPKLRELDARFGGVVKTRVSTAYEIAEQLKDADLVIGSVLIPGEKAPKLVTDAMVAKMKPGSVLVDIAIDQGGCFEDSHATTHADPTYTVHNSVFYCVANMPGSVPNTSTYALTNVTLPYAVALANKGWKQALKDDKALALGLNTHAGKVTYPAVAEAFGYELLKLEDAIA